MRIAYVTRSTFGVLGGASSYYVPTYAARHHDVVVLSPVPRFNREEVVFRNEDLDVREIPWQTAADLVANQFGELRLFDPDIVHLFHARGCLHLLFSLHSLFPRARWIIDFRSPPVMEKSAARRSLRLRYFLCQFYVDHVFTHSPHTLRDNIPLCFRPVSEVPPGVELRHFTPRPPPSAAPRKFLYVGSVGTVRRLDVLIRGFARYARGASPRPTLDLIGGGDAVNWLRAVADREGVADSVRLLGGLPQEEVYRRLSGYEAGVAWVPHELFANAPSLKLLEYSAAGLPFMASNTTGHLDYARRFGFRFPTFANTEEGVVDGLRRLAQSDAMRADVAANLEAIARFDWPHIVEHDVLPVYERLYRKRGATLAEAGA